MCGHAGSPKCKAWQRCWSMLFICSQLYLGASGWGSASLAKKASTASATCWKAWLRSKSKSKRSISSRLLRYATFHPFLLSQISHNGASIQRKCRVLCNDLLHDLSALWIIHTAIYSSRLDSLSRPEGQKMQKCLKAVMIFSKFHRRFPHFTIHLHHGLRHWPWMALVGIALPKCTWHAATSAGQNSSSLTSRKKMEVKRKNPHGKAGLFSSCWPMRVLWGMGPRQAFGKSFLDNRNHIPGFSFQTFSNFQTLWSWKMFHVKFLD